MYTEHDKKLRRPSCCRVMVAFNLVPGQQYHIRLNSSTASDLCEVFFPMVERLRARFGGNVAINLSTCSGNCLSTVLVSIFLKSSWLSVWSIIYIEAVNITVWNFLSRKMAGYDQIFPYTGDFVPAKNPS
jgi:hypothetical protein